MKGVTHTELEASRSEANAYDSIMFCMSRLQADQAHTLKDDVVQGLTYEELIGALLLARDLYEDVKEMIDADMEYDRC